MILLFGGRSGASIYRYQQVNTVDGTTAVTLLARSQLWAPGGLQQEALFKVALLVVSSNVGVELRVTPVIEGRAFDGQAGRPDARVTFTIPTPAAGERTTVRRRVGLYEPLVVDGVVRGRVGARGAWLQLLAVSTGAVTIPSGESNPDLRLEVTEVEWEPLGTRLQAVNA